MRPIRAVLLIVIVLGVIFGAVLLAVSMQSFGGSGGTSSSVPTFSPPSSTSSSIYSSSSFVSSSYFTTIPVPASTTALPKTSSSATSSVTTSKVTTSSTATALGGTAWVLLVATLKDNNGPGPGPPPPPYPPLQTELAAYGPNSGSLTGGLKISSGGPANSQNCLAANMTGYIYSGNSISFKGTLYIPLGPGTLLCPASILALSGQSVTLAGNSSTTNVSMVVPATVGPGPLNFTGQATTFYIS